MPKIKAKYLFTKDKRKFEIAGIGQISATEIYLYTVSKFGSKNIKEFIIDWLMHRGVVYISDPLYTLCDVNDLNKIKETKNLQYSLDTFDCDDFSFLKKGYEEEYAYGKNTNYAFGVIWVYSPTKNYGHALNFFFDKNYTFYFYEPQTDTYFTDVKDNWKLLVAFI